MGVFVITAAYLTRDQLKEIYIDRALEPVDTTQWYPRITRKDFTVGLNVTESGVDPDQQKCGDSLLRGYLYEAAAVLLYRDGRASI